MFCSVLSGGVLGVESFPVHVETDISNGLPCFEMVGYVGNEVKEAKDRVRTALKNAGYPMPVARITVNLSPGNVKKTGTGYDLPVALSVLACMGIVESSALHDVFVAGELSLSGRVCATKGILPMILKAKENGIRKFIIPAGNSGEGSVVEDIEVYTVSSLFETVALIKGETHPEPVKCQLGDLLGKAYDDGYDLSRIKGQKGARRAVEIAASGLHNVIMIGPPGAGKTLIARTIPSVMPPLSEEECLEVSAIYSVRGELDPNEPVIVRRPFVAVHSSTTDIALVGGGAVPRPGAVSLAHKGVLFLDETPEFSRRSLEALRQPLEDGKVYITRNRNVCIFPSDIMLVAAANPCPCGHYPDMNRCTCNETQRTRYMSKLSGPFLDRMDICVTVEKVSPFEIQNEEAPEDSASVRKRVMAAHEIQKERFCGSGILFNSQMDNRMIEKFCELGAQESALMKKLAGRYDMSVRTYYRVLKVARTIADLAGREKIGEDALLEAVRLKVSI